MDDRITAIISHLEGSVVDIYAQKKLDQIEDKEDIQNWKDFIREIKIIFSDKSKTADIKQKIEIFKQGKKHIADFMIEFKALAIKTEIDEIFLLKQLVKDMNLQKVNMAIEQVQKWHIEEEAYLWTLKRPKIILIKMEG